MLLSALLFIFGTIGMSHIIVDGRIFQELRNLAETILPEFWCQLFKCYQCCGFWCGLFVGYFTVVSNYGLLPETWYGVVIETFICGCAGSFLSAWGAVYLNVLEAKMVIDYKEVPEDEE